MFKILFLILVSLTSVLAWPNPIEGKDIDVTGIFDEELIHIERQNEEVTIHNKNGTKKINKLNDTMTKIRELVPKQIEVRKVQKKFNQIIDLKNKYMSCIDTKDEEDCTDLKEELDKLNISSSSDNKLIKTHVLNSPALDKIRRCSLITQDYFPGFQAVIQVDMTLNPDGFVKSAYINNEESVMTHELYMFKKCVVHFAHKLHFENPSNATASLSQSFVFGRI